MREPTESQLGVISPSHHVHETGPDPTAASAMAGSAEETFKVDEYEMVTNSDGLFTTSNDADIALPPPEAAGEFDLSGSNEFLLEKKWTPLSEVKTSPRMQLEPGGLEALLSVGDEGNFRVRDPLFRPTSPRPPITFTSPPLSVEEKTPETIPIDDKEREESGDLEDEAVRKEGAATHMR